MTFFTQGCRFWLPKSANQGFCPEPRSKLPHLPVWLRQEVGGAGFEPAKAEPTDLQSVPFDRFGTPPTRCSLLLLMLLLLQQTSKAGGGT